MVMEVNNPSVIKQKSIYRTIYESESVKTSFYPVSEYHINNSNDIMTWNVYKQVSLPFGISM